MRNASPTIEVLIYLLYVLITVDVFVSLVKWTCLNQTFTQKWIPQYIYQKRPLISYYNFSFYNIPTYLIRLEVPDLSSDKVLMQMLLFSLPPTREVATLRPDCCRPHRKTYLLFAVLQIDLQSILNKLDQVSIRNLIIRLFILLRFQSFLINHACTCFRRPFKYLSTFSNNPAKYKSMSFHVL